MVNNFNDDIIDRIRIIRDVLGLNQKDFAAKLGIGQSTLAQMETGRRTILDRHIRLISAVFGIQEQWIRNGEEPMFTSSFETDGKTEIPAKKQALINAVAGLSERQIDILADVVTVMAKQLQAIDGNKKSPTQKGKA